MAELGQRIAAATKVGEVETMPDHRGDVATEVSHVFEVHGLCPVSGNPRPGSTLTITYTPAGRFLEVISLDGYLKRYRGGLVEDGEVVVRDMEHVPQRVAADCARWAGAQVTVVGDFVLKPDQRMRVTATADP